LLLIFWLKYYISQTVIIKICLLQNYTLINVLETRLAIWWRNFHSFVGTHNIWYHQRLKISVIKPEYPIKLINSCSCMSKANLNKNRLTFILFNYIRNIIQIRKMTVFGAIFGVNCCIRKLWELLGHCNEKDMVDF